MPRLQLPAAAVIVLLAAAGCGGRSDRIVRTSAEQPALGTSGLLVASPRPLTLADVRRSAPGSPERALMSFWLQVQWGAVSTAVASYDPAVLRRIGAATVSRAVTAGQSQLLRYRFHIEDVVPIAASRLVTVDLGTVDATPSYESYVLHRAGGAWRITYDSVLVRLLPRAAARHAGFPALSRTGRR